MAIPFHSIGVKNGKEKSKRKGKETICTGYAEYPTATATENTTTPFSRTEAEGGMRYLQKDGRDNIEVLTVW